MSDSHCDEYQPLMSTGPLMRAARDFLTALRGLTLRGRGFLAAGVTSVTCAIVIGEEDLLRVGLLLVALPVCAAAFVCRTRYRLACGRGMGSIRVAAGDDVGVALRVDNLGARRCAPVRVTDEVPYELGGPVSFALDRIEAGGSRELAYTVRAHHRGRYQVGPLSVQLRDPFGLCELRRSFRTQGEVIVTPAVERLSVSLPIGPMGGRGELARRAAGHGTVGWSLRAFRPGDDLRRVHWRTSARVGELMVRREEQRRATGASLLLDTRDEAWLGEGPGSSFEWAVGAAASVAAHLSRRGQPVRLLRASSAPGTVEASGAAALLDELAVVEREPVESLRGAARAFGGERGGLMIVVLGRTGQAEAAALAAARPAASPAIAILVDVDSFSPRRRAARSSDLEACRATLAGRGWNVLVAGYGDQLAHRWSAAGTAAASRSNGSAQPAWATARAGAPTAGGPVPEGVR